MPITIDVPGAVAYNQLWLNPGWIAATIPALEDAGVKYFYGPNVCNVRVFTKPTEQEATFYAVGGDPATVDMTHFHIVRLIATYSTWAAYKTFVILDIANYADDPATYDHLDTALDAICSALADYGFEYVGQVDSSATDVELFLNTLLNNYFDSQ